MRLAHAAAVAELLGRSRLVRIAIAVPGVVAILVMTASIAYLSTTPSADQQAQDAMGSADWMLENVVLLDHGVPTPAGLVVAAEQAGAEDVEQVLMTADVLVDALPKDVYRENRPLFIETRDAGPFHDRFTILTGRWPMAPSEVVVSEQMLDLLGGALSFTVFDQADEWHVVGVIRDELDYSGLRILAAHETWVRLPSTGYHTTSQARLVLFWSGGDPYLVSAAISNAVPDAYTYIAGSPLSRVDLQGDPQQVFREFSLLWTLPMVTAIAGGVVVPGLLVLGWLGKVSHALWRVGADERLLRLAGWVAMGLLMVPSSLMGLAAGVGIGFAARPLWHEIHNAQLPQPAVPWSLVALVLVTVAVALLVMLPAAPVRLLKRVRIPYFDRQVLLLAAVAGVSVMIANRTSSAQDIGRGSMVIVGAMVLVAAVTALGSHVLLPARSGAGASTLAIRLVREMPGRRLLVATLTFVLGAGLGVATLFNTAVHNSAEQRVSELPPGAVMIGSPTRGVPGGLKSDFESTVNVTDPAAVSVLELQPNAPGEIWSMTPSNIEKMLKAPLTADQRFTLDGGGILVPDGGPGTLSADDSEGAELSATVVDLPIELAARIAGIISTDTADEHGWIGVDVYLYTGLNDEELDRARDFRYDGQYDLEYVAVHTPPLPPQKPYGVFLAAMALSVVSVAIGLGAAASGAALRMRAMAAGLAAQGVPRHWPRTVLLWQCVWIGTVSLVSAAAASVVGVGVIVLATPDSRLFVPWDLYGLVAVICAVTVAAAAFLGSRRIHQTERLVTV